MASPLQALEEFLDPNVVKVVTDGSGQASLFQPRPDSVPPRRAGRLPAGCAVRRCTPPHWTLCLSRGGAAPVGNAPADAPREPRAARAAACPRGGLEIQVMEASERPRADVNTPADLSRVAAALPRRAPDWSRAWQFGERDPCAINLQGGEPTLVGAHRRFAQVYMPSTRHLGNAPATIARPPLVRRDVRGERRIRFSIGQQGEQFQQRIAQRLKSSMMSEQPNAASIWLRLLQRSRCWTQMLASSSKASMPRGSRALARHSSRNFGNDRPPAPRVRD